MIDIENDRKVSVPIVCDEYMRATGFFYQTDESVYLITARHNCLKTCVSKLCLGEESNLNYVPTNEYYYPKIDIYFRTTDGFVQERINLNNVDGVKQTEQIDVLGVPLDLDPENYGYHVWTRDEIIKPTSANKHIETVGYPGRAFPSGDHKYDTLRYCDEIGYSVSLPLVNNIEHDTDLRRYGLMPRAVDEEFVGHNTDYEGFSGAPIIGRKLVGIHAMNIVDYQGPTRYFTGNKLVMIGYTRADVLPKLLNA